MLMWESRLASGLIGYESDNHHHHKRKPSLVHSSLKLGGVVLTFDLSIGGFEYG